MSSPQGRPTVASPLYLHCRDTASCTIFLTVSWLLCGRALFFVLGLCLDLLSLATTHSSSQLATYLVAVAGGRQAQGTGWKESL